MSKPYLFIALLALLLANACKEEVAEPRDFTEDLSYFPVELDQPSFYRVDSIVLFNTTRGIVYDTTRLEARETLVERFTTPDGQENFRGERWERSLDGGPWRFRQTYTVSRTNARAVRTDDNRSFNKLVFPLSDGKQWDGHTAFDDNNSTIIVGGEFIQPYIDWNYSYNSPDTPVTLPTGLTLTKTITVNQADDDLLIRFRFAYERYAPGLGRVERFVDARDTQCRVCCGSDTGRCSDLPWNEKAEKGFILHEVLMQ